MILLNRKKNPLRRVFLFLLYQIGSLANTIFSDLKSSEFPSTNRARLQLKLTHYLKFR